MFDDSFPTDVITHPVDQWVMELLALCAARGIQPDSDLLDYPTGQAPTAPPERSRMFPGAGYPEPSPYLTVHDALGPACVVGVEAVASDSMGESVDCDPVVPLEVADLSKSVLYGAYRVDKEGPAAGAATYVDPMGGLPADGAEAPANGGIRHNNGSGSSSDKPSTGKSAPSSSSSSSWVSACSMEGLLTLSTSPATLDALAAMLHGDGPALLPTDPRVTFNIKRMNEEPATDAVAAAAAAPSTPSPEEEEAGDAMDEAAATAAAEAAAVIAPGQPCLWRGVRNAGNTCYFAAVVQLLYGIAPLRRAILQGCALPSGDGTNGLATATAAAAAAAADADDDPSSSPVTRDGAMAPPPPVASETPGGSDMALVQSGLAELFVQLAFSRDGAGADAHSFLSFLSLHPMIQQDAQEFLTLLLDWLQTNGGPAVRAAVESTFGGKLLYDRRCGACGRSAKRAEKFLHLTLPVRGTLEESLSDFLKPEEVEGFLCEGCGQRAVATSHQYLRSLPEVLVVHLNRFDFDLQTLQRRKITSAVKFPVHLDMTPYEQQWRTVQQQQQQQQSEKELSGMDGGGGGATSASSSTASPSFRYELRAVLNHLGDSATSGHYTYSAKVPVGGGPPAASSPAADRASTSDPNTATATAAAVPRATNMWLDFNDSDVRPVPRGQEGVGSSNTAYLLVYHRVPDRASPAADTAVEETAANTTINTNTNSRNNTVAKSSTTVSGPIAAAAEALRQSAPTPAEFPPHLLRYVGLLNRQRAEARHEWLQKRRAFRLLLDDWAAVAAVVFHPTTMAVAEAAEAAATVPLSAWMVVPTSWLRRLGRFFLPPYVNVDHLCQAAAAAAKEGEEVAESASLPTAGATGSRVVQRGGASPLRPRWLSADATTGAIIGPMPPENPVEDELATHQARLRCAHGRVAPWADFKLVPPAAYDAVLRLVEALTALVHPGRDVPPGRPLAAADAGAGACSGSLAAEACPACCAAYAAAVAVQALHAARDASLGDVLPDAHGVMTIPDAYRRLWYGSTSENEEQQQQQQQHDGGDDDDAALMYVAAEVGAFAQLHLSRTPAVWQRLVGPSGLTGATAVRLRGASVWGQPSAASPSSSFPAAASLGPTPDRFAKLCGMFPMDDKGAVDVRSHLLCCHGGLAPHREVYQMPAVLWAYLRTRLHGELLARWRGERPDAAEGVPEPMLREMLHELLPRLPVADHPPCALCAEDVATRAAREADWRARLARVAAACPTLHGAAMLCLQRLGTGTGSGGSNTTTTTATGGSEAAEGRSLPLTTTATSSPARLLESHPNCEFFARPIARQYEEEQRAWRARRDEDLAARDHRLAQLRVAAARQREREAQWKATLQTDNRRRGGRRGGGGRGGSSGGGAAAANPVTSPTAAEVDPTTPIGMLAAEEAEYAALQAAPPPCPERRYACVPSRWVAAWGRMLLTAETTAGGKALPRKALEPLPDLDAATRDPFVCCHGGALLEAAWLNPLDAFWTPSRARRAGQLWGGAEAAGGDDEETFAAAAAAASDTSMMLPPLVVIPQEEYEVLRAAYGGAGATPPPPPQGQLRAAEDEEGGGAAAATAMTAPIASPLPVPPLGLVECGGQQRLEPGTCAACCAAAVARFDLECVEFTDGTFPIRLRLRKSRKQYYDATSTLGPEESGGSGSGGCGGAREAPLQHSTTLGELRERLVRHIRRAHGYAVLAADLEIMRGKRMLTAAAALAARPKAGSPSPPASPTTPQSADADVVVENDEDDDQGAGSSPQSDVRSPDALTLRELGVRDGQTLTVQSLEVVAPECARWTPRPAAEEVWEEIPPELLGDGAVTGAAVKETTAAFGDTRLLGAASPVRATAVAAEEASSGGVACGVCTFLNAEGMRRCEMCDSPLD